jgi:hypothetical protein
VPRPEAERAGPDAPAAASQAPRAGDDADQAELSDEEMAERVAEVRRELAETPVSAVVANHCVGLFELARLHLSLEPPKLDEARLAIDALACLVDGLSGRLGEDEAALRELLTQLRLAYVRVSSAMGVPPVNGHGPPTDGPTPGDGDAGPNPPADGEEPPAAS